MFEDEIRWFALLPVALLLGMAQLNSEMFGVWFDFPARPDWLWIVAFYATRRTIPVQSLAAFFVCGALRDCLLGARLGSGALAFVLVGWAVGHWRMIAGVQAWPMQALLAGWSAFLVALIRHGLDYGPLVHKLLYRVFFVSLGDGVLTGLVFLPLVVVLGLHSFSPCRERKGF